VGLKVKGLDEFRDAFARLRDDGQGTLEGSVREHMEQDVFPKTQELVPVATGDLKGTGVVISGSKDGSTAIKYGNSPVNDRDLVDYAAAVHEILEHRHAPPTQAKFVEEPLKESVPRLQERAGKDLEELAGGG
jgi:hypothetical protein